MKTLRTIIVAVIIGVLGAAGLSLATGENPWNQVQEFIGGAILGPGANTISGATSVTADVTFAGADLIGAQHAHTRVNGTVGTYTALATDEYIDVLGGTAQNITFPTPSAVPGKPYVVFANNSTITTTLTAPGGYSILGATTNTELNKAGEMAVFQSNGTDYVGAVMNK